MLDIEQIKKDVKASIPSAFAYELDSLVEIYESIVSLSVKSTLDLDDLEERVEEMILEMRKGRSNTQ